MKVKRALISVSDKKGILEIGQMLKKLGIEILSTGKTAKLFRENNIPVTTVAQYTKSEEILGGRVKTLHPFIFGAILSRRDNPEDNLTLEKSGIKPIDLVVVNLYPFEKVTAKKGVSFEEVIENIDIGGCSLIRAAAKNFQSVGVVSQPGQYPLLIRELESNQGFLSDKFLSVLAREAFQITARYDCLISRYLSGGGKGTAADELNLHLEKIQDLRYGENPHQKAAFYRLLGSQSGLADITQLQGKELSFNNYLDMNAAWEAVSGFDKPTAVIIKHTNPCGMASAERLSNAYRQALAGDSLSAFGGVVGLNRPVDEGTARELAMTKFLEVIIAPKFSTGSLEILKEKSNRRLIEIPGKAEKSMENEPDYRALKGGFLIQDKDFVRLNKDSVKIVTKVKPTKAEFTSLLFAWRVIKQVKSNAIVITQGERTVGIGAGQMSRVDAVKIAIMKLKEIDIDKKQPLVLASDAFFPFRDAIDEAAKIGVKAIIQPGGSKRDEEVIKACDEHNLSMVFTGMRHFRHQ